MQSGLTGMLRNGQLESCMSRDNDIEQLQTYLESCMSRDNDKIVSEADSSVLATDYIS